MRDNRACTISTGEILRARTSGTSSVTLSKQRSVFGMTTLPSCHSLSLRPPPGSTSYVRHYSCIPIAVLLVLLCCLAHASGRVPTTYGSCFETSIEPLGLEK